MANIFSSKHYHKIWGLSPSALLSPWECHLWRRSRIIFHHDQVHCAAHVEHGFERIVLVSYRLSDIMGKTNW